MCIGVIIFEIEMVLVLILAGVHLKNFEMSDSSKRSRGDEEAETSQ